MPSRLSGLELIQLKDAVVEDFDASCWRELAALTNHLDEVEHHPRLLRSLSFGDDDYDGLALTFLRKLIGQHDENLDTVVGYVNRKCANAGQDISSEISSGRKIVFAPSVFTVPSQNPDRRLVSVMMPFGPAMQTVYETIQIAAQQAGLECQRADNIWEHSTVIQDIFSLIFRSYIVVCDFSGKNPNVFYEAGIAHTLGKHVVPISQSLDDVPFDLKHHRVGQYLNNNEGREGLRAELLGRFKTLVAKMPATNPWL